jgi:uncharacterized protein (TIGR03437 family)
MFSSRTVLPKVQEATSLFPKLVSACRRRNLMILLLAVAVLAGTGVVIARKGKTGRQLGTTAAKMAIPPASASHFVKPVGAALADVASATVTTISAAAYNAVPFVAPESIVAAFGTNLAATTQIATAQPLPTELGGTSVEVNGRKAGLFFVSPNQVNYVIPAATEPGMANVVVKNGATATSGTVQVTRVAPAIFTANANGQGVPAAQILRVFNNGTQQRFETISQINRADGSFIPLPIDLGPTSDLLFLVLYVSGVRQASDDDGDGNLNESVHVLIGGKELTPTFVGPSLQFVGLEQINVLIPRDDQDNDFTGRRVGVSVVGLGYGTSNVVDLEFAGTASAASPRVASFGGPALAGDPFIINGTGFSPAKEGNQVTVSGRAAPVISATTTQLQVTAPLGIESGTVRVQTTQGEGRSSDVLGVRTSVSGIVEDVATRNPIGGVAVKVLGSNTNITATTNQDGVFVLADVQEDALLIEIDGGVVQVDPPYPKLSKKISTIKNRDNQMGNIPLQQATGSSGTIGSGSLTGSSAGIQSGQSGNKLSLVPQPVTIQTGDYQVQFPADIAVTTPEGANSAKLYLTPLQNARTPVPLPYGVYSTSIVQITPFNVKLDPGAKLIFPNTDGFPAGTPLVLYRYDQDAGRFVQEKALVAVSDDGQRIETEDNAIKITSYYFASALRNTTTVSGRVLDSDGKTPLQNTLVRLKGQESVTDGNGGYLLRYVPVDDREIIQVEVSAVRANSRIDRVLSASVPAIVGGITKVPDVIVPPIITNRPPTILVTPRVDVVGNRGLDVPLVVNDPDTGQTVTVSVTGAPFATITKSPTGNSLGGYLLHLAPTSSQIGSYELTVRAVDNLGGTAEQTVQVKVTGSDSDRPTATPQTVSLDEDTMAVLKLEGNDPGLGRLTFKIVSQPANGNLMGNAPNLVYKPALNFNGKDRFTFVVNNGRLDSEPATVELNVRPVNDPPVLTSPAAQSVNKGQLLTFAVLAADPDADDKLTITATGLPDGATLTPVTNNSSQFRWTPTQPGTYTVNFKVTDGGSPALSDAKETRIVVNDVSLLSVPNAQVIKEGQLLSFDVSVIQNTAGAVITATDLPQGATFTTPTAGSGQFRWTPGVTQAGVYTVSFKATIAGTTPITETKQVRITVLDVVRDLAKENANVSIWGAAGKLPQWLTDEGDLFGASIATGDLNGDGVPDVAIGAPGANGAGFDNGKVYVFFGRANWAGSIDLAKEKADVEILGDAIEDHFGASLAIADLNGDGKNDLIIGAPLADGSGLPDAGKVYAIFGNLTSANDSISKLASLTIIGSQRGEAFGASLAAGFLHTKNGPAADLVVGAPGYDAPSTSASLSDVGAAYVFFGSPQLTKTVDLSKTSASYKVTSTFTGGMAGAKVAVGNFNGDEYADFAISAPFANANGLKSSGAVFLGLGGPNIGGEKTTSQASSVILFGGREADRFGASLAMGDLNGDGKADLVVAAIGGGGPENSRPGAGNVYVLYGATTLQGRPPDLTIFGSGASGDANPDALGTSLAVGDVNGDGIADLIIGAPGADNTDSKRDPVGAVYAIYGARSGLTGVYDLATKQADWTAWGARPGDSLGLGAIGVANVNASEPGDVILGIPLSYSVGGARTNAGEVRIVFGLK